jgi:uncharacterized membrane protein YhhN
MIANLFFYLAVIIAIIEWAAIYKGWRKVEYFAKPGTMVALLVFVALRGGFSQPLGEMGTSMLYISLGLVFSLIGDVLLILPKEQFAGGLLSFLVAHICYIIGFSPIPPLKSMQLAVAGIVTALVLLTAVQFFIRYAQALRQKGHTRLIAPVAVYIFAIGLMFLSALFTLLRGAWQPIPALTVVAGAAFFLVSDAMLGWNRFVAPLRNGRLWYMVAYHTGQFLITLGALEHFLGK